ncbi:MAG: DUF6886 family protein [Bacteroidota bacterium]
MKLFHLSEKSDITEFIPRPSKKQHWDGKSYVWAIAKGMVHNYYFPRDCPRICLTGKEAIPHFKSLITKDIETYRAVVFLPKHWKGKFIATSLYRYEFDKQQFSLIDEIAGYYVSETTQKPIDVVKLDHLPTLLSELNVLVRFESVEKLREIRAKVIQTNERFSIIRWSQLNQ